MAVTKRSLGAIFHSTFDSEWLLATAKFRLGDDLNDIAIRCPVSRPGGEHRRPADGHYHSALGSPAHPKTAKQISTAS
jgi:hypothetical protein